MFLYNQLSSYRSDPSPQKTSHLQSCSLDSRAICRINTACSRHRRRSSLRLEVFGCCRWLILNTEVCPVNWRSLADCQSYRTARVQCQNSGRGKANVFQARRNHSHWISMIDRIVDARVTGLLSVFLESPSSQSCLERWSRIARCYTFWAHVLREPSSIIN